MKKNLFLLFCLSSSIFVSAQITTYPTGNVNIKRSTEFTMNILSVGADNNPSAFANYQNGIHSKITNNYNRHNIGVYSEAGYPSALESGRSVGVLGIACNSTDGYNYGVMGRLAGSQRGAGVYGSIYNDMGSFVNDRYAGFFYGPTYVLGDLKVMGSIITPSDIRLKENVVLLSADDGGRTLDKVLEMNVISYNYKQPEAPEAERDTLSTEGYSRNSISEEKHYGLSAQELQTIYPDLVKEDKEGNLGVNYVELVPILIRSIQELNQKIEIMQNRAIVQSSPSGIGSETKKDNTVMYASKRKIIVR